MIVGGNTTLNPLNGDDVPPALVTVKLLRIDEISRVLEVGARVCDRRRHIIGRLCQLAGKERRI